MVVLNELMTHEATCGARRKKKEARCHRQQQVGAAKNTPQQDDKDREKHYRPVPFTFVVAWQSDVHQIPSLPFRDSPLG